jgi:membrane-bound lytic murein transglycosylase MltF
MIRSVREGCEMTESARRRLGRELVVTLVVTLAAAASAAAGDQTAAKAPSSEARQGQAAAPIVTAKPWTGDFDGMVKRRRVRILTPYSRTHYFIDKGQPRGLVYDLSVALEDEINTRLKTTRATRVFVLVRPTSRDQLYRDLVEGRGDIIAAGVTVTPEGAKLVDFTIPGKTGVKEIVVTGPGAPTLNSVDDLSGQQVCVRDKSIHFESLTKLNESLKGRGKAPVVIKPLPTALEDEDILEMTSAGLVKTMVVDDYMAEFWSQVLSGLTLHPTIAVRESGDIAWAVRKNSPKLLGVLNTFAKTHRIGTATGNVLFQKYLKSTKVVKDSTTPGELTKFQALQDVFKKYGQTYDLDYVLMMAQGYQESRLDQSVKSQVGAVGVMQVMPATGKELKVGDIHQIESNVHAGVKYIRFMIDQYFANEPMDSVNKALFAFAAYNCGPARVRQLRAEAAREGLDPNVWFDNVEHIAGARIGRETVQYVSNIYKYYIGYQLALQELQEKKALKAGVSQ